MVLAWHHVVSCEWLSQGTHKIRARDDSVDCVPLDNEVQQKLHHLKKLTLVLPNHHSKSDWFGSIFFNFSLILVVFFFLYIYQIEMNAPHMVLAFDFN